MSTMITNIEDSPALQRVEPDMVTAGPGSKSNAYPESDAGISHEFNTGSSPDSGSAVGSPESALTEVDDQSALAVDEIDSTLPTNHNDSTVAANDIKTSHPVDEICMATKECVTGSGHHRQVISHIFGRNKKCTRALAGFWIVWCRQHYQRYCYRANKEGGSWALSQLSLVRAQLEKFEEAGIVRNWTIALRKKDQDALDVENTALLVAGSSAATGTPAIWERFLVPYLGHGKTFAEVRDVLDAIDEEFETPEYMAREKKKVFPGVEFLATFPEGKAEKAAAKVRVTKSAPKPTATPNAKATSSRPSFKRKAPSTNTNATAYAATISPESQHKRRRLVHGSDISEAGS